MYRWLLDQGYDPAHLAIAGDSAGGGLAMTTLISLRDTGEPLPAAAALIAPWVDLECVGESITTNSDSDLLADGRRTTRERRAVPRRSRPM